MALSVRGTARPTLQRYNADDDNDGDCGGGGDVDGVGNGFDGDVRSSALLSTCFLAVTVIARAPLSHVDPIILEMRHRPHVEGAHSSKWERKHPETVSNVLCGYIHLCYTTICDGDVLP